MSGISEAATAEIILGDYAAIDAAGKITILGAGWTFTTLQPIGPTAASAVVLLINIPAKFYGDTCSVDMTLLDDVGNPVELPGQGAIRIAQVAKVERPNRPGIYLPADMESRIQMLLNFPMGLPLQAGRTYQWRLEIDGESRPDWTATFAVLGPPPQPVIG